jgi:hypothetical protein
MTLILVYYETNCVGKLISLSFHAYEERPNQRPYVTYLVYKEWSSRELMNEIKENNYDMNILWKRNIACMWVLENNFVSTIVYDSNFS